MLTASATMLTSHVQSAGRLIQPPYLYLLGRGGQGSKRQGSKRQGSKPGPVAGVRRSGRLTQHVLLVFLYAPLQGKVWVESRLKRLAGERA